MRAYIYKITNTVNGKVYIGQTIQHYSIRFSQHQYQLNKGNHDNKKLQNAVNAYGLNNFIFSVIRECNPEERFQLEKEAIDENDSISNGYNILYGNLIIRDWIKKDLIDKPFQREGVRKFSEEDIYLIKSAQFLFGSLQRPLSRLLNCHSAIPYNIYHNIRYQECCARFNRMDIDDIEFYFNSFLEQTNFSLSQVGVLSKELAILCYILKNDIKMTNSEISDMLSIKLERSEKIGSSTWIAEKEDYLKIENSKKLEKIRLLIVYCNFHRQSITKLQKYVERLTTIESTQSAEASRVHDKPVVVEVMSSES